MKRNITKKQTKWHQSENFDASKITLHCYYDRERIAPYTNDKSIGSAALCNSKRGVSDGYRFHRIDELDAQKHKSGRCKSCQSIYDKLPD